MRGTTEIKIRGYHIDAFGHVNNARYIELLEEGRWQYMEGHPLLMEYCHREGLIHLVANINIDYRKPAALGAVLQIQTEVLKAREHSVVMLQTVTRKGADILIAQAEVTNVFLNAETGAAVPISGELVDAWPDLRGAGKAVRA